MKTIVLPGYSPRNKEWAIEVTRKVKLNHPIVIHEWEHWTSGSASVKKEVEKIIEKTKNDKNLNIISKSFGTRVLMHLTPILKEKIEKIILCGIPTKFENKEVIDIYKNGLLQILASKILVIQNIKDPFASSEIIKKQISSINPKIKFIEKERSNHNYPYYQEIQEFLK